MMTSSGWWPTAADSGRPFVAGSNGDAQLSASRDIQGRQQSVVAESRWCAAELQRFAVVLREPFGEKASLTRVRVPPASLAAAPCSVAARNRARREARKVLFTLRDSDALLTAAQPSSTQRPRCRVHCWAPKGRTLVSSAVPTSFDACRSGPADPFGGKPQLLLQEAAMSGLRVCGCLNWSVHCQEVQPCDLRQKAPADPFFKGGLVCAKLAPQGITKRHSFLESVRTVGDWEVHSCQGCHWDVYAQSSDRSLLLSANLESDVKRIEAMRASADYSPCFHVLLPPVADNEGHAANVAPGVTEEEETLVARLHVQQLAAQFLQKELEAMEARLSAIPSVFPESESQLDTLPELSVSPDLQELLQDDDAVWEEHQERLLTQLRSNNLQLAGDGRCDSPGHSAKYLTYSFLCPDSGNIIHTEQVHVKESEQVKASATMEKEGLIRGLKFLSDHGMTVKSLTTDRHPGIKKYMRLQCPGIGHYYDVWHVGKDYAQDLHEKVMELCQLHDSFPKALSQVEEKVPPAYSSEEGQKVPKEDLVAAHKARFLKF
ncbi:hypothetical protein MTO96_000024 [Rhipicephalus appendiculatus]